MVPRSALADDILRDGSRNRLGRLRKSAEAENRAPPAPGSSTLEGWRSLAEPASRRSRSRPRPCRRTRSGSLDTAIEDRVETLAILSSGAARSP